VSNKLDDQLKDYYEKQQLSAYTINQLIAPEENGIPWRQVFATACIFIAGIFGTFLIMQLNGESLEEKVIQEVVMNHNKQLNPDYVTNDISILNANMKKLDFQIIASRNRKFSGLVGARYCSIQGQIAAQLRFDDSSTLYVTKLNDSLDSLPEKKSITDDDIETELWHENNLLFIRAGYTKQDQPIPGA